MSRRVIYLIAGEPSGDRLGAGLMQALRADAPELDIVGIGGQEMRAAGLEPLFDIADLSVMGVTEVLPRLPTILRRLRDATQDVLEQRPSALVTIDAPSFGLRVAQRVRKADPSVRTVHYVAPSVWAWRPGRARHMAGFVDQVLALLPFEPPYMDAAGMDCDFVGHPVADRPPLRAEDIAAFRTSRGIAAETPLLLLAPGSRRGEVRRLMGPFGAAAQSLKGLVPDLEAVIPIAETVSEPVTHWAENLPLKTHMLRPDAGEALKGLGFGAADAGLVASGTVTLELAAAATPHVSAYRASWLTAAIVRRLVKVDTAHLVNLVLGEKLVPERIQENCTPDQLTHAVLPLLRDGPERRAQLAGFERALGLLGRGEETGSERAARAILRGIEGAE